MDSLQRTYRITRLGQARLHGGMENALKTEARTMEVSPQAHSLKKGSGTNLNLFRENWDRIFGPKKK